MERMCSVEGCLKPTRSARAEWCKMHYHRWYRHGSVDRTAPSSGVSASHGRRYKTRYLPSHPLAAKSGKVYEHRAVLYDRIGPDAHPCHWCGVVVDWSGELQADHLNGIGDDNRPSNLVPSCCSCNVARAMQARGEALRSAGWWSNHDTIAALATGRKSVIVPRHPDQLALFG